MGTKHYWEGRCIKVNNLTGLHDMRGTLNITLISSPILQAMWLWRPWVGRLSFKPGIYRQKSLSVNSKNSGIADDLIDRRENGQPANFELPNPLALRMHFMSGGLIEFHTAEHQYESTKINFGMKEDIRVIEVF